MDLLPTDKTNEEVLSLFCSPLQLSFDEFCDDAVSPLTKYSQRTISDVNQDEESRDSGIGNDDFADNEFSPIPIKRPFASIKSVETKKRRLPEDGDEFPITKRSRLDLSPKSQHYEQAAQEIKSALDNGMSAL